MARKSYAGNAAALVLSGTIGASPAYPLNITTTGIVTGWPDGSAGDFFIVVGRGTANEEKMLVSSRSGNTLVVDLAGDRGRDGTAIGSHVNGAAIEHVISAEDMDEANRHINTTADDNHTQYLNLTRHAAVGHTSAMLTDLTITEADIADGAVTSAKLANVAWTAYTPALTASTSNPTLGTGAVQIGRYQRTGRLVTGRAFIRFGTSGTAAGSGSYFVSLPLTAQTDATIRNVVGTAILRGNASGDMLLAVVHIETATTLSILSVGAPGIQLYEATNVAPFAWGASDSISLNFQYETI